MFEGEGVDLNKYYNLAANKVKKLKLLRYKVDGDPESTCMIIIDNCEKNCDRCNSENPHAVLLVENNSWKFKCTKLKDSITKAEQRSVNSGSSKPSGQVYGGSGLNGGAIPDSDNDDVYNMDSFPVQSPSTRSTVDVSHDSPDEIEEPDESHDSPDEIEEPADLDELHSVVSDPQSGARSLGSEDLVVPTTIAAFSTTTTTTTTTTTSTETLTEAASGGTNKDKAEDKPASDDVSHDSPNEIEEPATGVTADELSGWQSKYYVVLGFFIVFLIVFVLICVFLYFKLRKKEAGSAGYRGNTGNLSPGPHNEKDTEPLTPGVNGGGSFNFSGAPTGSNQ